MRFRTELWDDLLAVLLRIVAGSTECPLRVPSLAHVSAALSCDIALRRVDTAQRRLCSSLRDMPHPTTAHRVSSRLAIASTSLSLSPSLSVARVLRAFPGAHLLYDGIHMMAQCAGTWLH
jgi:hypothetical protein